MLFKNLDDIFGRIFELELHKTKMRKKLKANLNTSKMAEISRSLNMSHAQATDLRNELSGFESSRVTSNRELLTKDE